MKTGAALLGFCVLMTVASGTGASARCGNRPISQTQSLVDSFKNRPESLLDRFPRGEPDLSSLISAIVVADLPGTLDKALDLVRVANVQQRRAIGRGMASASRACQLSGEPDTARRIVTGLRQRGDRDSLAAFQQTLNPAPTAGLPPPSSTDGGSLDLIGRNRIASPDSPLFKPTPLPNPLQPIR